MKKRVAYKKESTFCAIGLAVLVLSAIAPFAFGQEFDLSQWQDSSERKAGTRQTIKIGEEDYGFVWIPAGEFDMGGLEAEFLRRSGERQIHVKLTRGVWMLETEVTQALYQEVTGTNPSYKKDPTLPVECVTYNDVANFCKELTKRLPAGLTADFPTEAEWEYACRAGTKTAYYWGDKADPNKANVGESKKDCVTPAKSYPANAWGLYDMIGNVSEWVRDWYASSYVGEYGLGTVVDPEGPKEGADRVTRGGSWGVYAGVCRSAYRYWRVPNDGENDLGARIVLRPRQVAVSPVGISHVVLIGVDGGGAFFREADTPNLDKIFADGAVTYTCLCENPTISAENWGAMLHGVKREIHGLTNGLAYSTPYPDDSPYPSVFRVIRENMPDAKLASICSWNPINIGVIENGIGVFKDKVPDDDAGVTEKVCEYLEKNQPTLLYVHYNEVDGAGHGIGFGGKEHLAKLHATDGYIQKIYEAAKKNGMLDSTLFIVTADHGGHGTMHGGWTDEEKYVMFAAAGPNLEKGGIGEIENRDMAAIVLYALGLGDKQPETWTSRVPSGLFKGVKAKERPVYRVKYTHEHREHASSPTPEAGSDAPSILGEERVRLYLPFDGDAKNATGKVETKQHGKLDFVDGYFGKGARFEDGYVTAPDCQPGKKSFSLAFWMKTDGVSSDPVILTNKDWSGGSRPGFVVALRSQDIKFNYGDGKNRMDADGTLPRDYYGGWVYVVIVVDRESGAVKISYDFDRFELFQIKEEFLNVSFDSFPELAIGQDATGKYKDKLDAVLDEFLLIDGTLDADDVAKLKTLYLGEE